MGGAASRDNNESDVANKIELTSQVPIRGTTNNKMTNAMSYEQWDAHTTELHNKHGHTCKPKDTGKPKGHLSQVSIYEFVNDWLRPEVAWQIYSYVGTVEDEHKASIQKRHRRAGKTKPEFYNENGCCDWIQRHLPSPDRHTAYNVISRMSDEQRNKEWDTRMTWLYQDNSSRLLIHYNPTVAALARCHRMSKKDLTTKLRDLNVKGRTKIMKTYNSANIRQPQIVTAIMKSPNYSTGYLEETSFPSTWWRNQSEYKRRHIDFRGSAREGGFYNNEGEAWQDEPYN